MRYMGSKGRIADKISPIVMYNHDQKSFYVEPFCGGGNILSEVPAQLKWGNDLDYYVVSLLKAISKGWVPPENISNEEYNRVKSDIGSYDPAYVGFVAYCCSYSGKWFGGYARGNDNKGYPRNFAAEQVRNLEKQRAGLKDCYFTSIDYREMEIPKNSTIYCDPPYKDTTSYKNEFNHGDFWLWCRKMSENNRVFVSEYFAPKSISEVVWEKQVNSSLTKNTGSKKATEKLFRIFPE